LHPNPLTPAYNSRASGVANSLAKVAQLTFYVLTGTATSYKDI